MIQINTRYVFQSKCEDSGEQACSEVIVIVKMQRHVIFFSVVIIIVTPHPHPLPIPQQKA